MNGTAYLSTNNENAKGYVGVSTSATNSGLVCKVTIPAKTTSSSSLSVKKLGKFIIKY